jgi:hypothetical protein
LLRGSLLKPLPLAGLLYSLSSHLTQSKSQSAASASVTLHNPPLPYPTLTHSVPATVASWLLLRYTGMG